MCEKRLLRENATHGDARVGARSRVYVLTMEMSPGGCVHTYFVSLGPVRNKVSLKGSRKNKKISSDILCKLHDILLACSGSISITTKGTFFPISTAFCEQAVAKSNFLGHF